MLKQLPISISDFKDVRDGNYYYIDKSLFIKELIDNGPFKVTLIPRPRRFGKTLNMSMLKYFFEKEITPEWILGQARDDKIHASLFTGLTISTLPEYMNHQGQYPVIFLTFKNIKDDNWEICYDKLKQRIAAEFERHNYILQSNVLTTQQKKDFSQIIDRTASQATFENSLMVLSSYLKKYYNSKIIILIDEYDAPIHAGFLNKYYEKTIIFMRGFLCGGLKDNNNIAYGILTGILRIAKESIFSGMNNLDVNTLLSDDYADKFGLTEPEVEALLSAYSLSHKLDEVRTWYNGYRAGQAYENDEFVKIYNPWSLLHFVKNKGTFGSYWVNTSDNKLIQDLIQISSGDFKKDFECLLSGQTVSKKITEDTIFLSLKTDPNALWSFLVFCGYLTWKSRERMQIECKAELIVPNSEVLKCFTTLIEKWFSQSEGLEVYQEMLIALKNGDIPLFKSNFTQSIMDHFSYFDVGGKTPERVYHAYVLGMIVALKKTHAINSNGLSGRGRYDVCIIPHDKTQAGTIIEFKAFNLERDKTMENAAAMALKQIEERKYETELRKHGVTNIIKYAIVFWSKDVLIAESKS